MPACWIIGRRSTLSTMSSSSPFSLIVVSARSLLDFWSSCTFTKHVMSFGIKPSPTHFLWPMAQDKGRFSAPREAFLHTWTLSLKCSQKAVKVAKLGSISISPCIRECRVRLYPNFALISRLEGCFGCFWGSERSLGSYFLQDLVVTVLFWYSAKSINDK